MMNKTFLLLSAFVVLSQSASAQRFAIDDTLQNVVVTGTRNATDMANLPVTVSVVGNDKLNEKYSATVLPTLNEHVPGFFATTRGMAGYGVSTGAAGGMRMRGIGTMANFLVLVDGQPQYAGLYGHPVPDLYSTAMAERVEVVRGPASLYYGSNAMGGVMNIVTRKMLSNGQRTQVQVQGGSYGTIEAHATNQLRLGKFSSAIGLNFNTTDGHRKNSEFEQYGGFAKFGYDFSEHWQAVANMNLTYFKGSNPGEVSNPYIDNDQWITRGFASVGVLNNYGKTSGAIRGFYDFGHHKINDGYHPGGKPQTVHYLHNDLNAGVSAFESTSLWSGNVTTLGFDWQHFGGEAYTRKMDTGEHATDYVDTTEDEFAGYIDFRQDLATWLTLDAGLRVDNHSQSGTELIPQGGFAFRLPHQIELKAFVSKGFRNPTLREMYMFRPANPNLKPERMMNYELAYAQHLLDNHLRLGLNLYYIKAENLIATSMVDGKPLNINTGEAENYGFEFDLGYRIDSFWRLDANYSMLHMNKTKVTGAPEHKLFVGGNYDAKHWVFNAGFTFLALYTSVGENPMKEEVPLLNATLSYKPVPQVRLFVKGENLFWQRYEVMAGYPMPLGTVMGGLSVTF